MATGVTSQTGWWEGLFFDMDWSEAQKHLSEQSGVKWTEEMYKYGKDIYQDFAKRGTPKWQDDSFNFSRFETEVSGRFSRNSENITKEREKVKRAAVQASRVMKEQQARSKRNYGFKQTIKTSPLGLTSQADIGRKTLLGQ